MKKRLILFILSFFIVFNYSKINFESNYVFADSNKNYYSVYEKGSNEVLFLKGGAVEVGDKYLSGSNKLYEVVNVDERNKTAEAKFLKDESLPQYKVSPKQKTVASAARKKIVGIYHTHNDESYFTPDGVDSVYGKGGIHDVGKILVSNFNKLGIETIYKEDLHLPHNSGAYSRSQVTASSILNAGADAIFDIHRDSTKRDYYLTKVNGKQMSSIRMVVGSSSINYEENKKFAYSIKSYADSAYPGLIKDIYFGKGNYNQQLSTKSMLFEMGCENIEKDLVFNSTEYLAKTLDVVLYGSDGASEVSLDDVSLTSSDNSITGIVDNPSIANSNSTLVVVLSVIGVSLLILILFLIFSKKARYKVGRFFSEMFAGLFGKRKKID